MYICETKNSKLHLQVYLDTVVDPEKYWIKLSERFGSLKFVFSKKADSMYVSCC